MNATSSTTRSVRVPPRWFVRTAWVVHRAIYRLSGGRAGLTVPRPGQYGMLRLRTAGRRSGVERAVILAYYPEGDGLVLIAMNGWGEGHPAWLYNLRAEPHAVVDLVGGRRRVVAREPQGAELERLWDGYRAYSHGPSLDDYQTLRPGLRAVVVVLDPIA